MSTSITNTRVARGIVFAIASFATLAAADALTKLLSSDYSIYQVADIDAVVGLLVVVPFLIRAEGVAALLPRRPGLVVLRSIFAAVSLITAFLAFTRIPLADAYTLTFISPLLVTALSAPLLGETVDWRQWLAVLVGFAAVTAVLRPDLGEFHEGQAFILMSALLFALSMLLLRRMSSSESSSALLIGYLGMVLVIALPFAIEHWRTPTLHDALLLVIDGVCSGVGNLLLILALRYAAASVVSSFSYTQLLWGSGYGLILFNDLPDIVTVAGSFVIVACGLYVFRHAATNAAQADEEPIRP